MSAQPSSKSGLRRDERELRHARFAMTLSLMFGVVMLLGKATAYFMTHSAAILSDAAESVVHVIAVGFAAFSLRLSNRPAAPQFLYGYERITFFSAGFEGGMIIIAAIVIVVAAVEKWIAGLKLENVGTGTLLVLGAGLLNWALGYYLVRVGRRTNSLILEVNGKHVLTDSWTSFGVVAGLGLVLLTHWKPFDPLIALFVAANILWSGGRAGSLGVAFGCGASGLFRSKNWQANSAKTRCYLYRAWHSVPRSPLSHNWVPPDY